MSGTIDMGPAMDLLAFDFATIRRTTSGYNAQGVLTLDTAADVALRCNIQPYRGKDVMRTPEGQILTGQIALFSRVELKPAKSPDGQSDEIDWRGDTYTVITSEQWDSCNYFRSILVKKEV